MSALEDALRFAAATLTAHGVRFALVGGLAISVRTEPRFTRDLDLAVGVESDAEAESTVRDLLANGWHVLAQVEHEATGRLATARLVLPPETVDVGIVVDLLFASSGIEPELVADAETLEVFDGVSLPVARVPWLLAMKVLAADPKTRPQDVIDARALLRVADQEDVIRARVALRWIHERGFDRGRDLEAALRDLLAERS